MNVNDTNPNIIFEIYSKKKRKSSVLLEHKNVM